MHLLIPAIWLATNLLVIAKHVETYAQRAALVCMGRLGFLGYLIGAPLSAYAFGSLA